MGQRETVGAAAGDRGAAVLDRRRWAPHAAAVALIGVFAFLNWRFILVHFSNGGYLLDSGWFAHLMCSADFGLPNPRSIADLSYYNMHVSPYLALFGAPLRAAGLDRFAILAAHQGLMFGLFALCLYLAVARAGAGRGALALGIAALAIGVGSNLVWRMASYPHFEIATVALCMAGAVLLGTGRPWLAAVPFAAALSVREDAGFFVALYLAGAAVMRARSPADWRGILRAPELPWAVAAALVSVVLFAVKAQFFFHYPTFRNTFSGHQWDHLSWPWFFARLGRLALDLKLDLTVAAIAALGLLSWRYLVYPVLVLPLVVAQLLAVQDGIGLFHAYYGIPWLVAWTGLLLTAASRSRRGDMRRGEAAVLIAFALASTIAVPNLGNGWRDTWIARNAITYPTVDLPALARKLEQAIGPDADGACLSMGAAALVPDAVSPRQVVGPRADLGQCSRFLLFRGDLGYPELRGRVLAAGKRQGPTIGDRVETYF